MTDNPQGFRLTHEEQEKLAERNSNFEKPLAVVDEIEDIFELIEQDPKHYELRPSTVTEFQQEFDTLKKYSVKIISQALDKLKHESIRKKINGKVSRIRMLPRYKRSQSVYYQ
ncbi:MAG: hypothetical protein HFE63_03830 [Clostridiales bacterium]|nr:hypothetical protein [Clostridiales bacterium]